MTKTHLLMSAGIHILLPGDCHLCLTGCKQTCAYIALLHTLPEEATMLVCTGTDEGKEAAQAQCRQQAEAIAEASSLTGISSQTPP